MSKCQSSKRARKYRKQAKYAGLRANTSHPTHGCGNKWLTKKLDWFERELLESIRA